MDALSPTVNKRLAMLARHFRDGLPAKIREIVTLHDDAKNGNSDALRALRMRVHRLAGTALTFGMAGLSERARRAEEAIEIDLSSHKGIIAPRTSSLIEELRSEGTQISVLPGKWERTRAEDTGDALRVVAVGGTVRGLPADFSEQLAVFGILTIHVREPDEILTYLDEHDDTVESCLFLAEVSYVSEHPDRHAAMGEVRGKYMDRIVTVLVGGDDAFSTRLLSVRFQADAFVSAPMDVGGLVIQLDDILKRRKKEPYHVLIVDEDPDYVSSIALSLQQAGMITSVVTDPENIFRVLVEYKPELVLINMHMNRCSGIELAAVIRQNENFVSIPIIFHSVEKDSRHHLEAVQGGGDDVITNPFTLEHIVRSVRLRASRNRQMRYFMERDSLTGLLNHTNLKQRLEHEVQRARRIGTSLVFAMVDIDRFKDVNDTYGHLTGDRVIKNLSRLLVERLRRTDVVGRYGGEEFGIILFNTDGVHAARIMNRIREDFCSVHHVAADGDFTVSFSCGLAEYPLFETSFDITKAADDALYLAKESGRDRIIVADRNG